MTSMSAFLILVAANLIAAAVLARVRRNNRFVILLANAYMAGIVIWGAILIHSGRTECGLLPIAIAGGLLAACLFAIDFLLAKDQDDVIGCFRIRNVLNNVIGWICLAIIFWALLFRDCNRYFSERFSNQLAIANRDFSASALGSRIKEGLHLPLSIGDEPGKDIAIPLKEKTVPLFSGSGCVQKEIALLTDGVPRPIENEFFDYKYVACQKNGVELHQAEFYRFFEGESAKQESIAAVKRVARALESALVRKFSCTRANENLPDSPIVDPNRRCFQFQADQT